ncbi:hypothetical protein FC50_GL000913 [Lacticaseibacillus pantheris DSM 15945 = JCM 12539 = NBRC 106106]|uniref:HTH cro/C1-type domain-containing protein n=1 Tax=Lacticaseibacillus pantheris DSM 15945 = JCM 12539 = NBRC 106106 TaxID=1423783 RepID=A0A0R1U4K7_9LACO|nr:helix-turn-helix transcriptional regulator [Lacticaseibacillus pantheris]KRL86394.1 hypothetical protein FC50_GL000913 [Lacticaseibacillus pantheris DSM 15945 = JCM 12539 = NBRC 106106]
MLPERLRELRNAKHLTQSDVAKRIGITRPAYTAYESGKRQPDYATLKTIASLFDVSTDYLIGNSDSLHGDDGVDLDDDNPFLSYQGRPVDPDDIELFKQIIRRTRGGDDK